MKTLITTITVAALFFASMASAAAPEFITVSTLLHMKKQNQPVVIVDVRNKTDYDTLHIPGAIHIPLYAVKTKPFLKSGKCVLVNNGFAYHPLFAEHKAIKDSGIDAAILQGGINAWIVYDRDIKGDIFAKDDIFLVSARQADQEYGSRLFLSVDVSAGSSSSVPSSGVASGKEPRQIFSKTVHLNPGDKDFFNVLSRYNKTSPTGSILIFNETGTGYAGLQKRITSAGIKNVFFLKGGLAAYSEYLDNLARATAPRSHRIKSINKKGCKSCEENAKDD